MPWFDSRAEVFGFDLPKSSEEKKEEKNGGKGHSFVPPTDRDASHYIEMGGGGAYGTFLDLDQEARNEKELIERYRMIALQPEVDSAIEDIVNEAIIQDDGEEIEINLDNLEFSEGTKEKIRGAFDKILRLLNWKNDAQEIFRRFYIDGRIFFHIIVDSDKTSKGIQELRYVDPRYLRRVKEIERTPDPTSGVDQISVKREYYLFNDVMLDNRYGAPRYSKPITEGIKIPVEAIASANSGLFNISKTMVLSHLHGVIKPVNQLRMIEDAMVIYRLSRAPERRVFYIDVGNLPKTKAEQYVNTLMNRYRNKVVYNASTGEVQDDKRHLSMMEDFWLPRREGGRGTEVDTLSGGENLGQIDDVEFFQKRVLKSLKIPVSRLEADNGFSLGRASEITRDELKFSKFVGRLRKRHERLFETLLQVELLFTGVIKADDWQKMVQEIYFTWPVDNYFAELKETEMLENRLVVLRDVQDYIGRFFSENYVRRKILRLSEEEIEEMKKEMEEEKAENPPQEEETDAPSNGFSRFRR